MGVSKNRGTPKWMVKIMENPIKMDDLGVPLFSETPISYLITGSYEMSLATVFLKPPFLGLKLYNSYEHFGGFWLPTFCDGRTSTP